MNRRERDLLDEALWGGCIHDDVPAAVEAILAPYRSRLASLEAERDSAQEHMAYHLADFRPGADMAATGDLAVDMAAYARRLAARLASVEALADEWESLAEISPLGGDRAYVLTSVADDLRAVLGSDAHTEQKGTGE